MPRNAIITYDGLPISHGGGHTLRVKDPKSAWKKVSHFLHTCTDFSKPESIYVRILKGPSIPSSFSRKTIFGCLLKYGFPRVEKFLGYAWYDFRLPYSQLNEVLDLVERTCKKIPSTQNMIYGPISLHITTKLKFINPETNAPLPFQTKQDYSNFQPNYRFHLGESVLYSILSSKSTTSVFFSIPFEEQTPKFLEYAQHLQKHLPFRFSTKTWKRWHLNKKQTGYVGRKIPMERIKK